MRNAVISPVLARRRTIKCASAWTLAFKCASAWTLAFAVLSVAIVGTVRYEPVLDADFDWPILIKLNHYVFQTAFLNRSIEALSVRPS